MGLAERVVQLEGGYPVEDPDLARLSPLGDSHLNLVGRYSFRSATAPGLRPLRQPQDHADHEACMPRQLVGFTTDVP